MKILDYTGTARLIAGLKALIAASTKTFTDWRDSFAARAAAGTSVALSRTSTSATLKLNKTNLSTGATATASTATISAASTSYAGLMTASQVTTLGNLNTSHTELTGIVANAEGRIAKLENNHDSAVPFNGLLSSADGASITVRDTDYSTNSSYAFEGIYYSFSHKKFIGRYRNKSTGYPASSSGYFWTTNYPNKDKYQRDDGSKLPRITQLYYTGRLWRIFTFDDSGNAFAFYPQAVTE